MKKLAILGASYLQKPLVEKAKEMGLETHVFAWRNGNVVEDLCDYYYDISILDKEKILAICQDIEIDGITSIASDIAMPAVNYVAHQLNLIGNPLETTLKTTDKFEMRKALQRASLPCPKFDLLTDVVSVHVNSYNYPVIVKPTDRSGSRGVTKVETPDKLIPAFNKALENSINKRAIVEEFIEGREFSVEAITYKGEHRVLAITDKVTTGSPFFVEVEHHQPAQINNELKKIIESTTKLALNALKIENGASHTEILINEKGVTIVEVAARMGGDFIGSTLTNISTGFDFLKAVINIVLGKEPDLSSKFYPQFTGIHFLTSKRVWVEKVINDRPSFVYDADFFKDINEDDLNNSSNRKGYFIYKSSKKIENDHH